MGDVTVVHGDASPSRTFDDGAVRDIKERFGAWFGYEYRYFNENTGTARGHNRMFESCTSDYVVVQNPDVQYCPRFFERMLEPFGRTDVQVGLVEARQAPIEHPKEYDPKTKVTPWSTSACIMVPSAVMREVQGFDAETFFLYCDDVDFSWRVRLTGRSLVYQPLAPVYHPKYLTSHGHWQSDRRRGVLLGPGPPAHAVQVVLHRPVREAARGVQEGCGRDRTEGGARVRAAAGFRASSPAARPCPPCGRYQ